MAAIISHLEDQLKTLSIHTRDEEGELLITRLEKLLQNEAPLPQRAAFERSQRLVQFALDDAELRTQTDLYFEKLNKQNLRDTVLAATQKPALLLNTFWQGFFLLLLFPLFAPGYAFWFLPCFLPWFLNKKMDLYIGYATTVKMLAGLFTFPLALWGAWEIGWYFTGNNALAWLTVVVAVMLGYFAEQYLDLHKKFITNRSALRLATNRPGLHTELLRLRAALLKSIRAQL